MNGSKHLCLLRCLFALVALWGGTAGCGGRVGGDDSGALRLVIGGASVDGARYRLVDAVFSISGRTQTQISGNDYLDEERITVRLPRGQYSIGLRDGWRLEKLEGSSWSDARDVTLLSSNSQPFHIDSNEASSVLLVFRVAGEIITLGPSSPVRVDEHDAAGASEGKVPALRLWNRLGGIDELENSEVGPPLAPQGCSYFGPGLDGNAVTLSPTCSYSSTGRYRNAILDSVPSIINPEAGAIVAVYKATKVPVAYENGAYRIFDGAYGLYPGVALCIIGAVSGDPDILSFSIGLGNPNVVIEIPIADIIQLNRWYTITTIWNRSGIGGSDETMQVFVDTVKVGYSTQNTWGTTPGKSADIGGGNDADIAQSFYLDDIKVYSGALVVE